MAQLPSTAAVQRCASRPFAGSWTALSAVAVFLGSLGSASPQNVDCSGLRAKIAALDSQSATQPNRYATAARQQRGELDRTAAYARSLGCDQPVVPIFGPPLPQRCHGLNAKIAQMQANLGQLEATATSSTDGVRQNLIARYDAYCRTPIQARQRDPVTDFFATLFGGLASPPPPPAAPWAPPMDESPDVEPDTSPRGGSQAVCVRSCDGGFFPLHVSARHADPAYLGDLCRALCPNVEASVYTRAPYGEIDRAVSLDDGTVYSELPNALKFRSSYNSSCSCKPARQSWVEALAGAEQLLGEGRRGDIVVTPEASEQLSHARPEVPTKSSSRGRGDSDGRRPAVAAPGQAASADAAASAPKPAPDGAKEVVGPDGVKRRVRIIAPTL